jgi:hypothetical protein
VSVGIYLVDVTEIDDERQTFNADVFVQLQWKDSRLANAHGGPRKRLLSLSGVWSPRWQIVNQRRLNKGLPDVVEVLPDGTVTYRQRFTGDFSTVLDLSRFPLDSHVLSIHFVCPTQSVDEIELVEDGQKSGASPPSILSWTVGPGHSQAEPFLAPGGQSLAGFRYEFECWRRPGYYAYQFLLPLGFIVCMSWACLWMSREQFGPRQGVAVTSMLTVIAYRFALAGKLPKLSYLTRFDFFLLGCTALVFLTLIEVVTVHRLAAAGKDTAAARFDFWSRILFPLGFVTLLCISLGE